MACSSGNFPRCLLSSHEMEGMRRARTEGCLHFPAFEDTNTISPGNQNILESYMTELLDGIDPVVLLPYLHSHHLVSEEDSRYIRNPNRTTLERNMRIVYSSPRKDVTAFFRFIAALEKADQHPNHLQLARLLRGDTTKLKPKRPVLLTRACSRSTPNLEVMSRMETPLNYSNLQLSTSISEDEESTTKDNSEKGSVSWTERKLSPTASEADLSAGPQHYLLEQKLKWLQGRVNFKTCKEEVSLTSKTSYGTCRDVLHSGMALLNGKSRVLVLCSDLLIVLKPMKSISWEGVDSHLCVTDLTHFEWFSQQKYIANMPLLLHLMEIRHHPKDSCSLSLCYQPSDMEMTLGVCTETARDVWIGVLKRAIKQCKKERETYSLPLWVKESESETLSGAPFWAITLTIMEAHSLRLPHSTENYHLFCTVGLQHKAVYRTPSAAGRRQTTWNYSLRFTEFATTDIIEIELLQENLFRPNECIGSVRIPVCEIPLALQEEEKVFNLKQGRQISGKLKLSLAVNREINV